MAAPSLSNVPTTISTCDATTGWAGNGLGTETDIKREGTASISNTLRNDGATTIYSMNTNLLGETIRLWNTNTLTPYMDTLANGGLELLITATGTGYWNIAGNDSYNGGWLNNVVSLSSTPDSGSVTPANNVTQIGLRFNRLSAPKNITNSWTDYLRYGDGYTLTGGTGGDKIDPVELAIVDNSNGYGIFENSEGVIFGYGTMTIGAGATATNFESIGDVIIFTDNPNIRADLYGIVIEGTGCDADIVGSVLKSAGTLTATRFVFDCSDTDATVSITGSLFVRSAATDFATGQTLENNTFEDCGVITLNGATLTACTINSSDALVTDDLDLLDACVFVSAGTGYAIDLGTISATDTMGWNCTDTGYAAQGGTATNRTILVNVASGQTLTINVAAGASTPTYNNTGAGTVNVVAGQVTTTITVVDIDTGSPIQNANVYVVAGTGGPLTEGDVIIGTTTLTDVSGQVTDVRSLASNQPITGRARRASPGFGTLYKTVNIVGTINSASGLDLTVQMQKDE